MLQLHFDSYKLHLFRRDLGNKGLVSALDAAVVVAAEENILRTDLRHIRPCTCIAGYDSQHDSLHCIRKRLDKDQHISPGRNSYRRDSREKQRIQVGNMAVVQSSLEGSCRSLVPLERGTARMVRSLR
jgi:hypothetical protein